ncbi:pirin-like C-terminal cupin domain-containing protein [Alkalihalophilus lindianensis]|uniref:Pirin-like C-terminal cupin domain-containing protein n=1 Tax=Alkalihalophilus lindianensis TaxID=1630542 RepID=A0ABU3XB74_9BACI|nr:pirin-like C-terminal cupin domain-containing protein [Alkalihalophilus lindianensis]MDV2684674.1 pirin-like C-terminal cupin domain-containing protein [Alkalihalophilus lindianensis]
MDKQQERYIRDHWKVKYNKNGYPHVQQGWVLPPDRMSEYDPFILMADDWFKRGTFSDHPHRGFQTITYVIDGRLEHTDNNGGHSVLHAGDVQYMNAGSGARHAEEAVDDDLIHTLQLWLNLPKELKQTESSYQNVYVEDAPKVDIEGGYLRVYSGTVANTSGPMNSLVPINMVELYLKEGATYSLELPRNHNGHVYMLQGELEFAENVTLQKTEVGLLSYDKLADDKETDKLKITAHERSRVLIYTGKLIQEPVVARGPFVMNTEEEIKEAFNDFRLGKFGLSSQE